MLSESEQSRIVDAVKRVEEASFGEVVVSLSPMSDHYKITLWRSAIFFGLLAGAVAIALRLLLDDWPPSYLSNDFVIIGGMIVVGATAAGLFRFVPALRRLLVTRQEMRASVEDAAFKSFVTEEVFGTRDRTGILLYFSEFEREVVLLADSGITSVVPEGTWLSITDAICKDMKSASTSDAIVNAVERCGEVLSLAIAAGGSPNANELGDSIRQGGASDAS